MAQFNNTTKDNIKNLNSKQTVIVETVTVDGKKTRNVYLGNYKRRKDAYYEGMAANGMKASRKEQKEYRLLKLSKLLAEVSVKGYNTKTNYLITDNYNDEEPVVMFSTAAAPAAEPEAPAATADAAAEPVDEQSPVEE